MSDEKLDVGIQFNVSGNSEAAGALNALGTAAAETAADFDLAAVSAKAMADAITGAQALAALGIKASAPGAVNSEGQGLVTVAADEQAAAQSILSKLGLEAVAVTREQAAATLQAAAASREAAAANLTEAESGAAVVASSLSIAAAARERLAAARAAGLAEGELAIEIKAQNLNAAAAAGAVEQEATGATSALGGMWTQLIAVVAALEAYNKAKEFIGAGVDFNASIESARLGIAASVNAMATLTDAQGKALEGQEKFGAATAIADDQIQKLFADSARTSTTVQQLVTTYQSAIAAGLNAGATLDQIRRLTTDAALTAGALNIPYSQLSVTLVQLLEGHTRITNRLSQELGITQADLKEWKEKGTLVENLLDTFGKYETLGTRVQGTWRGVMSNVTEFFQQFSGAATSGAFDTLETGIKAQLGRVFDFNSGKLSENIKGAADLLREGLGGGAQLVVDLVAKMVNGLEEAGRWFEQNRAEAEAMGRDFVELVTNTGRIVLNLTELVGKIVMWAAESVLVQAALRTIGDIIGFVSDNLGKIVIAATALTLLFNASAIDLAAGGLLAFLAALNPVTLAIGLVVAAITGLTFAVEGHNIAQERAAAALEASRQRMVEHAGSTASLVAQYEALAKSIDSGKLKGTELANAQARLKSVTDDLIKVSPDYKSALSSETEKLSDKLAAVEALHAAEIAEFEAKRDFALQEEQSLERQREVLEVKLAAAKAAERTALAEGVPSAAAGAEVRPLQEQLDSVTAQEAIAHANFGGFEASLEAAQKSKDALAGVHNKKGGGDKPEKGLDGAEAAATIERIKAEQATMVRALDAQLAANEISYADYFARLNAIELSALDVQIAAKQQQLAKTSDPKEKIKIGADIEKLQEDKTQTLEKNAAKRAQLEQQYDKQRTAIAIQSLKDQGEAELAYDLQFEEQHRALVARATAEGDTATLAAIDNEYAIGKARMEADKAAKQAAGTTSDTEGTVRGVQASVETGAISEARGRELIIAAYQREAAAITTALDAAEALAKVSPTPDNIAKVDTLAKQYGTVEKEIAKAADTSLHLRAAITSVVSSDVAHYLTDTITHVHSLGEAFRGLAATVLKSISDILAKIIEAALQARIAGFLGSLLGAAGGSIGGASALGNSAIAGSDYLGGLADGGHVSGPGSATSDSIPAMLSDGEYVVRASAVAAHGIGFFDAINAGSVRMHAHAYGGMAHFADGGAVGRYASGGAVVGSAPGAGPEAASKGPSAEIRVSHDASLTVEHMRSDAGVKVIFEALARNTKLLQQLSGARR